ncbi:leucine-rich colipase-like protein 1 [Ovis canadensis]|uniref:leucine-rich colipase-like protein 1 n=1 Tax=Ovis canadensis TaxID=37174 RepID=UPI0037531A33
MASAGRLLLLLLCLLPVAPVLTIKKYQHLSHKSIGDPCETHSECQSDCCVTNSLNPQKFCTAQTVFQQCLSWKKPNGYICKDHLECQSKCCVVNNYGVQTYCKAKTIFLQCLPWRKPNWDYCNYHIECRSKCCIRLNELSPNRCVPQSGILLQCLPWSVPWRPPYTLSPVCVHGTMKTRRYCTSNHELPRPSMSVQTKGSSWNLNVMT